MFTWDASLETGEAAIDVQHKELVRAFNDLETAIERGEGGRVAGRLLLFMKYYALWHFDREEKCMERYRCPVAEINKQAHAVFLDKFTQMHVRYQGAPDIEAKTAIARQMHAELSDWIVAHILKVDAQVRPYAQGGPPAAG